MNDTPGTRTALQAEVQALRHRVAGLETQPNANAERERVLQEEQDRNQTAASE